MLLIEGILEDGDINKDTKSLLLSGLNMQMITVLNSHERTLADWKELLALADTRFELTRVIQPPASSLSVLEVTWRPNLEDGPSVKNNTVDFPNSATRGFQNGESRGVSGDESNSVSDGISSGQVEVEVHGNLQRQDCQENICGVM